MQKYSLVSQISARRWSHQFILLTAAVVLLPLGLQAQTPQVSTFIASRGDWFDGINWSTGRPPEANTTVRIDGSKVGLRGLPRRPGVVIVAPLSLANFAELDVDEARMQMDTLSISDSSLRTMSSHLLVLDLAIIQTSACAGCRIKFNPSLIEAQRANFGANAVVSFGLGGTNPASANALGRGNYARLVTRNVTLASRLEVEFLHGFVPQAGQQFKIIDVTSTDPAVPGRTGTFSNAAEGALVARYNNLGLYITYAGGDGNDVVLTVRALPAGTPPLVYAKQDGGWFDPATWSDNAVPTAAKEHILLARQINVPASASASGPTATAKSLTLREDSRLEVRNSRLALETLNSLNSNIRIYSSYLLVLDLGIIQTTACLNGCGVKFNPSFVEARNTVLGENATMSFGLAGTDPAAAGRLGAGHYAHLKTDTADLRGNLEVEFLHGFAPQAGQQFQIITVNSVRGRTGTFANAREGALVTRYNSLGLYITYFGGDGDDVVLTVQPLPKGAAPLVHATQDGDWFAPTTWSDNSGPPNAAKEHILLARQVGLTSSASGPTAAAKTLTLREGSQIEVRNARLELESLSSLDSNVSIFSSHLLVPNLGILPSVDCANCTIKFNPSLVEAQSTLLGEDATMSFGLAGTSPAAAGNLGTGHYARVVTDTATLEGNLAVEFLDGFTPQVGQRFEIIRVNLPNGPASGLIGRFANVREGGIVADTGTVRLVLSYVGGDGNDVVLTAVPAPPAQSLNISTRVRVETGENVMIGGFIVTGPDAKQVLIRALGPSLRARGVNNAVADPVLDLRGSDGALIQTNDNWRETQEPEIIATTVPPTDDLEAALVATLAPGNYTATMTGKGNTTGVGLIEIYDLDAGAAAQLANISTRGLVLNDTNVLIGGFIVGGSNVATRMAVRALGPSLTGAGIANALADPTLDVRDANGARVLFNDNWMDDAQQAAQLAIVGLAPRAAAEAALLVTVPPGNYTAIVAGKNGGTGVGLVEVYNLQ